MEARLKTLGTGRDGVAAPETPGGPVASPGKNRKGASARSMRRRIFDVAMGILVLPMVLLARLLRPLILVRFGNLRNHTIGTLALHAETYMCDRELRVRQPKSIDFFFHTDPRANRVLDRMLARRLNVTPLARYCYAVNSRIPGYNDHICILGSGELDRQRDHYRAYTQTKPHFDLSEREKEKARRILREDIGVPQGAEIICFCSRTSSYLRKLHENQEIRTNDEVAATSPRDSSIENYLAAAEALARRGYYVLRMGAVVDERIHSSHERVIDYATHHRSELLDIFLCSECRFFLSDTTGLHCIPFMFRRPVANANHFSFLVTNVWGGVFIPKKYWLVNERRFMTVHEIVETVGGLLDSGNWDNYAKRMGVEFVENTPEEILDLAVEMDDRLRGTWRDTPEDEEMQRVFWSAFEDFPFSFGRPIHARIATTFLRRHPDYISD